MIMRIKLNGRFKEMHVKVFNTGKIEVPGIKEDSVMDIILNNIIQYIKPYTIDNLTWRPETLQTILINSNFDCNFHINREILKNRLKFNYNLEVYYDSCVYPGIQCKYYKNDTNNGVCYCEDVSSKKKKKTENINNDIIEVDISNLVDVKRKTRCKCISVSFMIFRTGNVLIVGHCSTEVLMQVYNFIKTILEDNYDEIKDNTVSYTKKKKENKKIRKKMILVSK